MNNEKHPMKKWRMTALVALVTFSWTTLHPSVALAYNESTHKNIADWAYRIMGRVLADFHVAGNPLTAPPCNTDPCLQEWNDFMTSVARGPGVVAVLPIKDPNQGVTVPVATEAFPPALNKDSFSEVDSAYPLLNPPGSALSDDSLGFTNTLLRFNGAWLGRQAAAADWEDDDWHTSVDIGHLIVYGVAYVLTLGNASAARELAEAASWVDRHAREVGGFFFGLALIFLTFPVLIFMSSEDRDKFLQGQKDWITHILTIDKQVLGWIRPEDLGIVDSGVLTGLGHFINMQPESDDMPTNEFDDRQGIFRVESYWISNPDQSGSRIRIMDTFDHYLLDVQGIGAFIDPVASNGVRFYQALTPDDGHPASVSRENLAFSEEAYWRNHTLDVTAFTPVDNLGYFGWKQWRDDPCKRIEKLERPLHALQDASVPMHTLGVTGFGHRPYEDSVAKNVGLWNRIRHVSDPPDAGEQALEKEQIRRILLLAFEFRRLIQSHRAPGETDVPIRDLVTDVAQRTQDILRATSQTISCQFAACRLVQNGDNQRIQCDRSKCSGFDDLPELCRGWDSASFPDDPDDCPGSAYVALALSDLQYGERPIPALLAPGLGEFYFENREDVAVEYYTARPAATQDFRFIQDQRAFLEVAVASNVAFLASAADAVPGGELDSSCYFVP